MPGHLGTYHPGETRGMDHQSACLRMVYSGHHEVIDGFQLPGLWNTIVKDNRENTPGKLSSDDVDIYIDGEIYDDSLSRLDDVDHIQNKIEILEKANGYFSAVVLDRREHLLYWISDRFGLKPLYIFQDENHLSWSSEIKSLIGIVDPGDIDRTAVTRYMRLGYLPGDSTWYDKVRLLPAATTLKLDLNSGQLTTSRYWSWSDISGNSWSFDEAVEAMTYQLTLAIKRRIPKQGRPTISLSGGLDSRFLAFGLMGSDPLAFSFGHKGSDDVVLAEKVCRELGIEFRFFDYTPDNWLKGKIASIWRTEGMMPFFHLHSSPFCEAFEDLGAVAFNGFGGASLLGGLFMGKSAKLFRQLRDTPLDMDHYRGQHPESLVMDHHMRRFANQGSIDEGKYLVQRLPYVDTEVIDVLFSLPDRHRRNYKLFHEMIRRSFPRSLLPIPWENTGWSVRSRWINRTMQQLRWPSVRRRMRMGRWAFDYKNLADHAFKKRIREDILNDRALIWDVIEDPDRYMVRPFRNLQVAGRLISLELWLRLSSGQTDPDEDLTRL